MKTISLFAFLLLSTGCCRSVSMEVDRSLVPHRDVLVQVVQKRSQGTISVDDTTIRFETVRGFICDVIYHKLTVEETAGALVLTLCSSKPIICPIHFWRSGVYSSQLSSIVEDLEKIENSAQDQRKE